MSAFFDRALVALALLASIGYAALALGPRSLKRSVLARVGAWLAAAPRSLRLGRTAQRLRVASQSKAGGACGGCDNCGSEAAPAARSSGEVKVPVAKIGRRV